MNKTIFCPETTIPVTIITGFLGSGKTSLLNHKNQLVIIGQNLDTEELKKFLEACIS